MSFEIVFIVVAVIGFVVFMVKRTIETVLDTNRAIFSLAYILDNVRYTIMFLSFLATQILGYIAINKLLDNYSMPVNLSFIVNILAFVATVLISALITTSIVQAERAIAEGGYSTQQFLTIATILIAMSIIDYNSLKEGATQVFNQIEQYKVKEIKKVDNLTAVSLNSTISLLKQKQKELKEINEMISYSSDKERAKLFIKRDKINSDIERLSNKIAAFNNKLKEEQAKAIQELKSENRANLKAISEAVIGLMLLAFLASSARSILLRDTIELSVNEIETETKGNISEDETLQRIKPNKTELQQKYVIEAMKEYADQMGYTLGKTESIIGLKFARDKIVELAKAKALKDNIVLELGKPTAQRLIDNLTIRQIVGDYLREKSELAA